MTAGTIKSFAGSFGATRTANGTYTDTILATVLSPAFSISTDFDGYVDNVSIKEAIDSVGTKAYHDGTAFQNPITGMTLSSADTAPVLSIVNDQTAINTAKLERITNSGKMYDCTTGAGGAAVITFTGAMTAVLTSFQQYLRVLSGSCVISDSAGENTITPSGSTYVKYKKEGFTAVAARTVILTVAANSQVRFSGPDLEGLGFCTSWKPSEGATAARAATVLSYSTDDIPATGARKFPITWTPSTVLAGYIQYIWSSYTDANNELSIFYDGTNLTFRKRVSGTNYDATKALEAVVGQAYIVTGAINVDNTTKLGVAGEVYGGIQTNTTAPVIAATMEIGSRNGAGQTFAQIKDERVTN
jgi:hypothetical protein